MQQMRLKRPSTFTDHYQCIGGSRSTMITVPFQRRLSMMSPTRRTAERIKLDNPPIFVTAPVLKSAEVTRDVTLVPPTTDEHAPRAAASVPQGPALISARHALHAQMRTRLRLDRFFSTSSRTDGRWTSFRLPVGRRGRDIGPRNATVAFCCTAFCFVFSFCLLVLLRPQSAAPCKFCV